MIYYDKFQALHIFSTAKVAAFVAVNLSQKTVTKLATVTKVTINNSYTIKTRLKRYLNW